MVDPTGQLLVFRIGGEAYGLDVVHLWEIMEDPVHHYFPRMKPPWRGAINVHGSVLPVLDLAALFACSDGPLDRRVLVLAPDVGALALAVTRVEGILRLDGEQEEDEPEAEKEGMSPACGALDVLVRAGKHIHLLDLEGLLARLEALCQ
ncbi:MAG: chemotaxis protein CheW [Desulfuromonadaceae bacterium]